MSQSSWWLSFCDPDLPKGTQFLGACIVVAEDMPGACIQAHLLGCNPGGEVQGFPIPEHIAPHVEAQWRRRVLSRGECSQLDEEMARFNQ